MSPESLKYPKRARRGHMWLCPTCGQTSQYLNAQYTSKRSGTKWTFSYCEHTGGVGESPLELGILQVPRELPELDPAPWYSEKIQSFLDWDL